MTNQEILDIEIGGIKLMDLGTMSFLGWMADKLNNVVVDQHGEQKQILNELTMLISNPTMGRMPNESKIAIINKLEKLGIQII